MRPSKAFDACFEAYQEVRYALAEKIRTSPLDAPDRRRHLHRGGRPLEYAADFKLLGARGLARASLNGRRAKLFQLYFVDQGDYREVLKVLGISPDTFDFWVSEIKKAAGREFLRSGLYPIERYFREACERLEPIGENPIELDRRELS